MNQSEENELESQDSDGQVGEDTQLAEETPRPVVRRKPTPTPFDHPLSFPLLVFALGLWFGYDGWFNPKTKSVMFNRVMCGVCMTAFIFTIRIGLREMRIVRERKAKRAAEEAAEQSEQSE